MIPENGRFSRFEPRKRGSEPRFRGSKRAGISRVNLYKPVLGAFFMVFGSGHQLNRLDPERVQNQKQSAGI